MTEMIRDLMVELKNAMAEVYGNRLKGVYLYGSYARGDQDDESDIDVMVVLDHFDNYGAEIKRTSELDSTLSLKYGVTISLIFLRESEWLKGDTPLLRNVREEAILA
jgi:predicted nucleotidyltransferase